MLNATVHVVPIADLITHDLTDDCVCGPQAVPVERDDGSTAWMAVHHALDGRELTEPRLHPNPSRRLPG